MSKLLGGHNDISEVVSLISRDLSFTNLLHKKFKESNHTSKSYEKCSYCWHLVKDILCRMPHGYFCKPEYLFSKIASRLKITLKIE